MWNTSTGDELLTLDGHRNVVYAIAFNNPWGDKVITGSFDKTCKLWNAEVGVRGAGEGRQGRRGVVLGWNGVMLCLHTIDFIVFSAVCENCRKACVRGGIKPVVVSQLLLSSATTKICMAQIKRSSDAPNPLT